MSTCFGRVVFDHLLFPAIQTTCSVETAASVAAPVVPSTQGIESPAKDSATTQDKPQSMHKLWFIKIVKCIGFNFKMFGILFTASTWKEIVQLILCR